MLYDIPSLVPTAQLPATGIEGQMTFLTGVGLHQYLSGSWVPVAGGSSAPVGSFPLSQMLVSTTPATLYVEPVGNRTVKEVTIVSGNLGSAVTLTLTSGGQVYYILKNCYLDAYLTTILELKIPLDADDVISAQVTEGPDVTVTVSAATRGTESLIVKQNATGQQTLYTADSNKTITNLVLCNTAGVLTTTTMNIRRSGSQVVDSVFFNELQTNAGEVVLGDINTAIDIGSTIAIDTDQPITILMTA